MKDRAEEIQKALAAFEDARKKLAKSSGKSGQGIEDNYSSCWKKLVALGRASKLKGRYNV